MRVPVRSGQFRRDVRRAAKRGKDMSKLRELIQLLVAETRLPERYKDHPLRGNWRGYRDAHIEPDWLLFSTVSSAKSCTWSAPAPMPTFSMSKLQARPALIRPMRQNLLVTS